MPLDKVLKALKDYAYWEISGSALLFFGRSIFSWLATSNASPANERGMILTPKGWELDNQRLRAGGALWDKQRTTDQ